MEGERESSPPPFWSRTQRTPSFPSSPSSPSTGIRPWVLVLLASIFLLLFLPSFLSSSFRGFRPSLVKNGWDTLNLLLVLFAIFCGLLGRNSTTASEEAEKPPPSNSHQWVGYQDAPAFDPVGETNPTVPTRRMRSSSSYPDLRQEAAWGPPDGWRFSDDIQLYRSRRSELHREWEIPADSGIKTIPVDTFEVRRSPSPTRSRSPPTPQPPPPPPPPPPRQMRRRVVKKLPEREVESILEKPNPPTESAPPPPPPPPPMKEEKRSKAKKDIATTLALFYQKNKKKRSKVKKIHDDPLLPSSSPSTPPPPPPPPPPPSVFHQLFSNKKVGSKSRRSHSFSVQPSPPLPPPPPPPPPQSLRKKKERSKLDNYPLPPSSPPPPPPPPPAPQTLRKKKDRSKVDNYPLPPSSPPPRLHKKREKSRLSYSYSPIHPSSPLPPPPPPPPPPLSTSVGSQQLIPNEEGGLGFCPSPDVNNKADLFIARFRAGLKLEKLNSIREKQKRQQQQEEEEEEIVMMMGINLDDDPIAETH